MSNDIESYLRVTYEHFGFVINRKKMNQNPESKTIAKFAFNSLRGQ